MGYPLLFCERGPSITSHVHNLTYKDFRDKLAAPLCKDVSREDAYQAPVALPLHCLHPLLSRFPAWIASLFRLKLSTTVSARKRRSLNRLSYTKSILQLWSIYVRAGRCWRYAALTYLQRSNCKRAGLFNDFNPRNFPRLVRHSEWMQIHYFSQVGKIKPFGRGILRRFTWFDKPQNHPILFSVSAGGKSGVRIYCTKRCPTCEVFDNF